MNFLALCMQLSSTAAGVPSPDFDDRTIDIPLPTHRLASSALRALQVDAELSPLVRREFSLASPVVQDAANGAGADEEAQTILRTEYRATTNRMLRVAVNGFMESLGVVLQVMEELDVDVLEPQTQS
jgi:EKC/KEOPS complex subunit PCC1/LAGE3